MRTVAQAIDTGSPKLIALKRQLGETALEAYMKLWLVDLGQLLDLKKPLNERQIDDIAFRIVEKYPSLNLADVTLIFERVKDGEEGKMYDRLTVPVVMSWFRNYMDERTGICAERSRQRADSYKGSFSRVPRSSQDIQNAREAMREAQAWDRQTNGVRHYDAPSPDKTKE